MSLDGWLTQGVVTTKIYCRPSCPARPKPENVRVFESLAAARAAGMRACKRCKPDEAYGGVIVRHLEYQAPLDAGALLAFFGARAVPGVEELDGEVFRRSLRLARGFGVVELRSLGERVAARFWLDDPRDEAAAIERVRAMLDSRKRAIRGLAEALASGELALSPGADRRATEDRLLALPGIGPWTASYIAMRALRDSDAFLASDLGVKHALDRLGLDSRPKAA